ncbi:phosphotransferase family protein [Pseudonocardia sp. KRD-184]|uniref:Phosphotransferase family protein n=1 Tax=Pseudonocardia oceani TaxID=2792013 RepID=A0ABS6U4G6_9PSEU|nr:phosphotransferase family protein [Pseudonocardia oceani]MBW0094271.1 phosphotransferase family protein [Pseudonocardia oceani]MBW0100749.1 phosphotransferase family protein [Pseudonocardia oceani]MBW0113574.1 phosphotransferase family protein [Pseudonocardia oceani]MBW0124437.1 phosphotransferase family protein [Pseudonocardia oceani]MBW0126794.1 phosphotransferase family protein [Pseudonocardia oceani]
MTIDAVPAAPLAEWFRTAVPGGADGPLTVTRISGGHSNLTYRIADAAGSAWALRRPPTGMVLATAHDMGREWRFITALADTPVPVAEPVALCTDADVIGAEFYVMGFVEGDVLGDEESGHRLAPDARHAAGLDAIDVLAALHAVDPDEVGLADLRRPGSYLERQLRRWHRQVHASAVPDLDVVDAVHARLAERAAALPPSDVRIAHGDFRLGNLAVGPDGTVRAVFDWELATLGDPLADLGWIIASWGRPGDHVPATLSGPSLVDGWADREELVARYAQRSGRDVSDLDLYVAFARWRSACIGAGVYSRYAGGVMGDDHRDDLEVRLQAIRTQAAAALDALGG